MGFRVLIFLFVPMVLTMLAWREGIRANRRPESGRHVRVRTWPAMLFLAGTVLMVFGLVALRIAKVQSLTSPIWYVSMLFIGGASSIAALVSSTRGTPGFRLIAFFAALSWLACFGLVLFMLSALSGLR